MAEKTKKQGAKRSAQVEFWAYTVLYFVLGLLFLIFNQQLTLIICYILGAALLLGGVVQVVSFLVNRAETTLADRFALCDRHRRRGDFGHAGTAQRGHQLAVRHCADCGRHH